MAVSETAGPTRRESLSSVGTDAVPTTAPVSAAHTLMRRDGAMSSLRALSDALWVLQEDISARGRAPVYRAKRDMRFCPSSVLRIMHWLTGEPSIDSDLAEKIIWVLDRAPSGGCFKSQEDGEAFDAAVRHALAVVLERPAARAAASARLKAVQAIAPYTATASVLRLPKLSRDTGEFDFAGQALTEAEVRGRVLLHADPVSRSLRPEIADAAIRLLARSGYDVDVPPAEHDSGWVRDHLGQPGEAERQMAATVVRWDRTLVRASDDDRPGGITQLLTLDVTEADFIRRMPGRLDMDQVKPPSMIRDRIDGVRDLVDWLCTNDIGPPVRWSSLRVGLLGAGDGRARLCAGAPRQTAVAELVRGAGYSVRPIAVTWTESGSRGLLPWLAGELSDALRRDHLAQARARTIDVIAVEETQCQAVLAQAAPCPVVHVVELIDWAYGGPVPAGLAQFSDTSIDVARPAESETEAVKLAEQ